MNSIILVLNSIYLTIFKFFKAINDAEEYYYIYRLIKIHFIIYFYKIHFIIFSLIVYIHLIIYLYSSSML